MVSHREVAEAFAHRRKARGSQMFTDGTTVWSYGTHCPLATRTASGTVLINTGKYSVSTSRHQKYVRTQCDQNAVECSLAELRAALDSPHRPVVIVRLHDASTVEDGLKVLERAYHRTGATLFPRHQFQKALEARLVLAALDLKPPC